MTNRITRRTARRLVAACAALSLAVLLGGCDYESDREAEAAHDDIGEESLSHLNYYHGNKEEATVPQEQPRTAQRRRDTIGEEELNLEAMYGKANKKDKEEKTEKKAAPERQTRAAPREPKVELTDARGVERRVTFVPAPAPAPEYRVPRARSAKRHDDAGELDLNY